MPTNPPSVETERDDTSRRGSPAQACRVQQSKGLAVSEAATRRTAGIFGLLASLFIVAQVPLYFLYETPPDWDILARSLIGVTGCTLYLVFFTGMRHLVRSV